VPLSCSRRRATDSGPLARGIVLRYAGRMRKTEQINERETGEINNRLDVYSTVCCGSEIVIVGAATFASCPHCQWQAVPETSAAYESNQRVGGEMDDIELTASGTHWWQRKEACREQVATIPAISGGLIY